MTQASLDTLCDQLTAEFTRDPKGSGVVEILSRYAKEAQDWHSCRYACPESYSRNLIHRCSEYELLLLCWGPGQASPIHDHSQQSCWMAVLEGTLEEVHFRTPGKTPEALVEGRSMQLTQGQVAFIEDDIALHLIRPVDDTGGVSLHLYAKPIDSCLVFDPATGVSSHIEVGYSTVRGEPCLESAEKVRASFLG